MNDTIWIHILVMAIVSFIIRALPLSLIRKPITNPLIRSFLYYVPYVTLSVMTFPAIVQATKSTIAGFAALICAIVLAWQEAGLFKVAVSCCAVVLIMEYIFI